MPVALGSSRPALPELFMCMGCNYLIKMLTDLPALPLPIASDPMLLAWFHKADGADGRGYFDAARVHGPKTLTRMKRAAALLSLEAKLCGMNLIIDSAVLDRPDSDLAANLCLLAYGSRAAWSAKTAFFRQQRTPSLTIHALIRRCSLSGRLFKRQRDARAAVVIRIQRRARSMTKDIAEGLAILAASSALANATVAVDPVDG